MSLSSSFDYYFEFDYKMYESCEYYFKTKWKGVQECVSEDNDISFIIKKMGSREKIITKKLNKYLIKALK